MNNSLPSTIKDVRQLEDLLSAPTPGVIKSLSQLQGDLMILGVGGKMGPTLARMARRAADLSGHQRKIFGASKFESESVIDELETDGIKIFSGDLLDEAFLASLPDAENVIYMAGLKFGSTENAALTWAINTHLPALVAKRFRGSRIVAFSTGNVYPLVPVHSGGCVETDDLGPIGEYAQSCLGRERIFQHFSQEYHTPMTIIRLNYAVEMRYGVLTDIALKVKTGDPIDLSMGHFNAIWQGDANAMTLQASVHCASPAFVLNVTGPEIISIGSVAQEFGKLFRIEPKFVGQESGTALLNNAARAHKLFGQPRISLSQMIAWIGDWIARDQPLLNKPTHFEERKGKY